MAQRFKRRIDGNKRFFFDDFTDIADTVGSPDPRIEFEIDKTAAKGRANIAHVTLKLQS